ncbi:MAG: ATP-binding protein [Muribaculaceae bacterium]|nr:ATP-binding protein [Muribaculaceae bacterium]
MAQLKYPIGVQTFPKMIEGGYAYVDKTRYVAELVRNEGYYFLSRPRRFGKSLLLSTLQAFYEGRRELFDGLAIANMDLDWIPSPVLHIDFNTGVYGSEDGLRIRLERSLEEFEAEYGVTPAGVSETDIPARFERVIRAAYERTGRCVVILVDEYDKPLLALEEGEELFEKHQSLLKGFFGSLKSMDAYIRFALLTGVARFNKVSIFSDVNNLDDISLSNQYADICGLTEDELVGRFREGIEALSSERCEDFSVTLGVLRDFYDGYRFAPKGTRLYNPFSVLLALRKREVAPYWFETGTPTFLARRIKSSGIDPVALNSQWCSRRELTSMTSGSRNTVTLMYQTGYLTIHGYDAALDSYELGFPNREVEVGFAEYLLPLYLPETGDVGGNFDIGAFRTDLYAGNPEMFMERLLVLLKGLPGEDHLESTYRGVVYLLCTLSGADVRAEHRSYKGRSDLEVMTPKYRYIFEFKYNSSAEVALRQIHDRDYNGPYSLDSRTVYLIGANFNERKDERGLTYIIEKM